MVIPMSWGIKKGISLFFSGFATTYAVEKYGEIKEISRGFSKKDKEVVNKIIKTGEFQLPDDDQEEEKDTKDTIAW